jgi:transglutaminase-like putative cysteine protease
MRLSITQTVTSLFAQPSQHSIRELRIAPRTFEGQYVDNWRIDVDQDCRLERSVDPYGNVLHSFSVVGPIDKLGITATGEVEVDDPAGMLQASISEKLPPMLFLRDTHLTMPTADLIAFASDSAGLLRQIPLDACHQLMRALHATFTAEATVNLTAPLTKTAAESLSEASLSPTHLAQLFATLARTLDIPARVVSGYLFRDDGKADAAHAWAEAFVSGLGWIGFDAAYNQCPTGAYVRIASGLDLDGILFTRGFDQTPDEARVETSARIRRIDL